MEAIKPKMFDFGKTHSQLRKQLDFLLVMKEETLKEQKILKAKPLRKRNLPKTNTA